MEERYEEEHEKQIGECQTIQQHEDAALKTSMQFFAEELLPYLKIPGKVVGFAPTELVHLELQKLAQDFNLVMEDGTWKHFEFQSTNEGKAGLKRFRSYEALASYQHKVEITTYVLYSGMIRQPMTEFTEGINTYRVVPIIMREMNADQLFAGLLEKVEAGENLTKKDLVPLTLCPLMGGSMPQKERIRAAYRITRKAFLVQTEDISMTRLGQMLVNRGMRTGLEQGLEQGLERGLEQGIAQGIRALIQTCRELGVSREDIAARISKNFEIDEDTAQEYLQKYWKA